VSSLLKYEVNDILLSANANRWHFSWFRLH